MKEQNENIKTFCDLLGEAQVIMQQLGTKIKNASDGENEDCKSICTDKCEKSMPLRSVKQLSEDARVSESEQEVKLLPESTKHLYTASIGIQVNSEEENDGNKQGILKNFANRQGNVNEPAWIISEAFPSTGVKSDITRNDTADINERKSAKFTSADQEFVCCSSFVLSDVIQQEVGFSDSSIKKDTLQATTDYDSSKTLEKSKKSTSTSEKKSICDGFGKKQELEPPQTAFATLNQTVLHAADNKISDVTSITSTKSGSKKQVTSLKDLATEVVITTVISKTANKNTAQAEPVKNDKGDGAGISQTNQQENKQVIATKQYNVRIGAKSMEVSNKNKLSIQRMPLIDIRRGLITQKIPAVVITSSESTPQLNVPHDSNVAYEIVKHPSSESVVTKKSVQECFVQTDYEEEETLRSTMPAVNVVQPVTVKESVEKCSERWADIKSRMCDNGVQTEKIESDVISGIYVDSNQLMKENNEMVQTNSVSEGDTSGPLLIDLIKEADCCQVRSSDVVINPVSVDLPSDDDSPVTTYDYVLKKKSIPQEPVEVARTSVQATLKSELPVTTFVNTYFKPKTESELLVLNEAGSESCGAIPRKSYIAELKTHKECIKEFINEMITDPSTEIIFKSYQVLQDQSAHDPEETVSKTTLSFIDRDVYRTFIDPEGFENVEDTFSSTSRFNNEVTQKVVNYNQDIENSEPPGALSLFGQMPPEFYSTKATQCEAVTENETDDNVSGSTYIQEDGNVSQCSFLWRNDDGQTLKFFKAEHDPHLGVYDIAQDTNSFPRVLKDSSYSMSPCASSRFSHSSIPRDIQKSLSVASGNPRNSLYRKFSQSTRILDADAPQDTEDNKSTEFPPPKHFSLKNNQLKSRSLSAPSVPYTSQNTQRKETDSEISNNTENLIFEIDKELLRSKAQNSKLEFDVVSISSGVRKRSSASKRGSISSNKIPDHEHDFPTISASEYVITHDVSLQTSLTDLSETMVNLHQYSRQNFDESIESPKGVRIEDVRTEDDVKNTSCCTKLLWNTKKRAPEDIYTKSVSRSSQGNKIQENSSLVATTSEYECDSHEKSVKTEGHRLMPLYKPKPMPLPLSQKVRRRLSRKAITPVESFITGLTNYDKDDIVIARNVPPRDVLTVFEEHSASDIVNAIKHATETWKKSEKKGSGSLTIETTENVLQTAEQNLDNSVNTAEANENNVRREDKTETGNNKLKTETENSDEKIDTVTIMSVNVEQPEVVIDQKCSIESKEADKSVSIPSPQRNVPGGDDADYSECLEICNGVQFSAAYAKHEGIFPRHHRRRHKQIKKVYESSSSSEAATLESETLSEGEVKCKCSASMGEIHVCSYTKGIKPVQYLKRNPQSLIKYEFGDPDVRIQRQKEFYSSWVAYYISRSPSPELDNTESLDNSTDSSGMVRK